MYTFCFDTVAQGSLRNAAASPLGSFLAKSVPPDSSSVHRQALILDR
jgi:hypothetical protein